ncbi:MAG TPA: hypothetical protein H9825_01055 [Candidatus Sphingobacterium stercorigallinarum]|nr:hypothetical protein [Candidatus Sphingobacterium stercorigallinarum]
MKAALIKVFTLLLVVFQSCSADNTAEQVSETSTIDYSTYNAKDEIFEVVNFNRSRILGSSTKKTGKNASKDEAFRTTLENINKKFGANLEVSELDKYQIENSGNLSLDNYLEEGLINKLDYSLMKSFEEDVYLYDFEQAIKNLEHKVLTSSLSEENFNRYSLLLNTLLLANDFLSENNRENLRAQASSEKKSQMAVDKETAACAVSIAANAVSTYGLASCFVPGPQCWASVAGKALSLAGIYLSC